jgi:hypothetical protein
MLRKVRDQDAEDQEAGEADGERIGRGQSIAVLKEVGHGCMDLRVRDAMRCGGTCAMRCDAMRWRVGYWNKEMYCDCLLACHMVDGAGSCCGGGLLLDQTRDGLGMTRRRLEGRFGR